MMIAPGVLGLLSRCTAAAEPGAGSSWNDAVTAAVSAESNTPAKIQLTAVPSFTLGHMGCRRAAVLDICRESSTQGGFWGLKWCATASRVSTCVGETVEGTRCLIDVAVLGQLRQLVSLRCTLGVRRQLRY